MFVLISAEYQNISLNTLVRNTVRKTINFILKYKNIIYS